MTLADRIIFIMSIKPAQARSVYDLSAQLVDYGTVRNIASELLMLRAAGLVAVTPGGPPRWTLTGSGNKRRNELATLQA
jgi:hypothetical protein